MFHTLLELVDIAAASLGKPSFYVCLDFVLEADVADSFFNELLELGIINQGDTPGLYVVESNDVLEQVAEIASAEFYEQRGVFVKLFFV